MARRRVRRRAIGTGSIRRRVRRATEVCSNENLEPDLVLMDINEGKHTWKSRVLDCVQNNPKYQKPSVTFCLRPLNLPTLDSKIRQWADKGLSR